MRYISRTKPDCLCHQLFRVGCRFGRSGVVGYDLLHTSYFEIEGFLRAMACYTCYIYTTLRQFINHQDFLLNNLRTPQMISQ